MEPRGPPGLRYLREVPLVDPDKDSWFYPSLGFLQVPNWGRETPGTDRPEGRSVRGVKSTLCRGDFYDRTFTRETPSRRRRRSWFKPREDGKSPTSVSHSQDLPHPAPVPPRDTRNQRVPRTVCVVGPHKPLRGPTHDWRHTSWCPDK